MGRGGIAILILLAACGQVGADYDALLEHEIRHCKEGDFHPRDDGLPEVHRNIRTFLVDIIEDPETVKRMREEYRRRTGVDKTAFSTFNSTGMPPVCTIYIDARKNPTL